MPRLETDPAFNPVPPLAAKAAVEKYAYVTLTARETPGTEVFGAVDTDSRSPSFGRLVRKTDLPQATPQAGHKMPDARLRAHMLMSAGYLHGIHLGKHDAVLKVRAAHAPTSSFGFAAVALSLAHRSAAIWVWHKDDESSDGDEWKATRVIEIAADPADPLALPETLRRFGAVPPLVTGLELSPDDCFLYVSCWGTGELRRYDVSNPFAPTLTGSVRLGGVVGSTPHPAKPLVPVHGGPQAAEISADGERVYLYSSSSTPWDSQFYPAGVPGWLARVDVDPDGTMSVDRGFLPDLEGLRPRCVRLGN